LDGSITPRLLKIKKILDSAGRTDATQDILGVKWTKLVMNCMLSGISAALGCTFGVAAEDPKSMRCMVHLCNEGAEIMKAKGLIPIEMEGFLPTVENYSVGSEKEIEHAEKQIKELISYSLDEVASMLQDIWAGKTVCEIDDINGKVVSTGKELGLAAPFNEKVVEIVKGIMTGEYKAEFSNIKYFEDLLGKSSAKQYSGSL